MLRQILALILASIIVLVFTNYFATGLGWMLSMENAFNGMLKHIFANGALGQLLSRMSILIALPVLIGSIPISVYYLINKKQMPYTQQTIWGLWLVLASLIVYNA